MLEINHAGVEITRNRFERINGRYINPERKPESPPAGIPAPQKIEENER